jgi:hypothetical protein
MAFTNRNNKVLPKGTMERFIAYGFKHYGDTVIMGNSTHLESIYASGIENFLISDESIDVIGEDDDPTEEPEWGNFNLIFVIKNDASDFLEAMDDPAKYIDTIRGIIFKHHYSPIMNTHHNQKDWSKICGGLGRLAIFDPVFGFLVANLCGKFSNINSVIIGNLLLRKDITEPQWRKILNAGFNIDEENCGICY